jgi:heat shock protein HspQ
MALTKCPGYPRKEFSNNGEGRSNKLTGSIADVDGYSFIFGASLEGDSTFALQSASAYGDDSGGFGFVEEHYILRTVSGAGLDNNVPDLRIESGLVKKELRTHPDYLTKWEYDLATVGDYTEPSWYDTAKDMEIPKTDAPFFRWVKENSELPSTDWYIAEPRTKPGEEGYYIASDQVIEILYYSTIANMSTAVQSTAKILTPSNTFGKDGGNWLVMSNSGGKEGKKFVLRRTYQYAGIYVSGEADDPGWDTDLYSAYTPATTTTTGA